MQLVYRKRSSFIVYPAALAILVVIGVQQYLQGTSLVLIVIIGLAFLGFAAFAVYYAEQRDGGRRIVEIWMSDDAMEATLTNFRAQERKVTIPLDETSSWSVEGATHRSRDILFMWRGEVYRFHTHQTQTLDREVFNRLVPELAKLWYI